MYSQEHIIWYGLLSSLPAIEGVALTGLAPPAPALSRAWNITHSTLGTHPGCTSSQHAPSPLIAALLIYLIQRSKRPGLSQN